MTEREWLTCRDRYQMVEFLGRIWESKLRLFVVACCRVSFCHYQDERQLKAIELAERMADEVVEDEERLKVSQAVDQALTETPRVEELLRAAEKAVLLGIYGDSWHAALGITITDFGTAQADERRHQLTFIHDIVGLLPFCLITIDLCWLTSTVVDLATAIYSERAFERTAILADALMDGGCDDEEIIAHCRGSGPHVRGCWVVDLLLGKG